MTEKLGLTVRLVPPEELARFLNASLTAAQATVGQASLGRGSWPPSSADLAARGATAPTSPAREEEARTEPPSPRPNFVRALEDSRRARRDGSRTNFEAYLVYKEGGFSGARLNRGHWQPSPLDTVAGLGEETRSALMADEWAPESYVDSRMFQDDDDSFQKDGAILPGSDSF